MVMVHQVCDVFHRRPGGALEEALAQGGKGDLIHHDDLSSVTLPAQLQMRCKNNATGSLVSQPSLFTAAACTPSSLAARCAATED